MTELYATKFINGRIMNPNSVFGHTSLGLNFCGLKRLENCSEPHEDQRR